MSLNKQLLRKEMQNNMSELEVDQDICALKLCNNLLPLISADSTNNVAIYHSIGQEISLSYVIEYLQNNNKYMYQPVAYKNCRNMRFELVRDYTRNYSNIFYPNDYHILNEINLINLDLIILPLLAVDMCGNRLGKGGGYYDKTLENVMHYNKRPILVGVGYGSQFVNDIIEVNEWDIRLDYFASEIGIVEFNTTSK